MKGKMRVDSKPKTREGYTDNKKNAVDRRREVKKKSGKRLGGKGRKNTNSVVLKISFLNFSRIPVTAPGVVTSQ